MTDVPSDDLVNLHLDEVTGERVSKTELKKRNKQREVEKRKAEKAEKAAQSTAANPPNKKSTGEEESNLTPNVSSRSPCFLWCS